MSAKIDGAPAADPVAAHDIENGAALAAFVAAGVGAFALGLIVLLNEADLYAAPTLYGPAGGVSGRTTFAVLIWLIAWALLHRRWRNRHIPSRRAWSLTLALVSAGLLATFPLFWPLL